MDPIETIHIHGDSTFALLLEAQNRRHSIFYYTPDRLFMRDGRPFAQGHALRVDDVHGAHYELGERETIALEELNVIYLRQDPPFDRAYATTTHILDHIHPKTLVVNDPSGVRNAPGKLFVTEFPHLTPPTLITRSIDEVNAFRAEYGDVVVKPLYGDGGTAIFRVTPDDTNAGSLVELFQNVFKEPFVVQQYLPEVRQGDKRIILVDGKPAGAINRIPAAHETRSNIHVGGRPEATELTARECDICDEIGSELKKRGLIFVGIDVIGDYLTEINVTSPTGIREVKRFGGPDIAALIWEVVEEKICSAVVR